MKFNAFQAATALVFSLWISSGALAVTDPIEVNVDNFARAQADHEFVGIQKEAGGVNKFKTNKAPTPIDRQPVIRMNRDTLYSLGVFDISAGVTITLPDAGDRYLSMMVINNDGYVNKVFYGGGSYTLTVDEFDTPYVAVVIRILVNDRDPADLAAVNKLQDQYRVEAGSGKPFVMPDYDETSYKTTLQAMLTLGKGLSSYSDAFGSKEQVNPVHFLLGTAFGWGGLPHHDAMYENVQPILPVGKYELTVKDVPVKAFWSISVYDKEGYFLKNSLDAYNLNNLNATQNKDGSYTIRFGDCATTTVNCLPISQGWNYGVRMYRPEQALLDGKFTFPYPPVPRTD
jgi:hypothetical protein